MIFKFQFVVLCYESYPVLIVVEYSTILGISCRTFHLIFEKFHWNKIYVVAMVVMKSVTQ